MFNSRGWRGWVWPLILASLIVVASSRSEVAAPDVEGIDKVGHFLVFGLLATLVVRNGFLPGYAWLAVTLVSVFGMTDEWHQSFTPGRSVEFADWVADTFGAMLAVALYARWGWYRGRLEGSLGRKRPKPQVEISPESVPNPPI